MHKVQSKRSIFCGILSCLLGGGVLIGWYAHQPSLIQVHPSFVPMQYNTALGFLICGLAMIFANLSQRLITRIFGTLSLLIGGLTLLEYNLGVDFRIDQLLMEHYITVESPNPGRMAINTALCFSLMGASLLIMGQSSQTEKSALAAGILASLILAASSVAFAGYLLDLKEAYGWGGFSQMALHTALGFVTLGLGVFFFAWRATGKKFNKLSFWIPHLIGIGGIIATFIYWQAVLVERQNHLESEIAVKSDSVVTEVLSELNGRINGLKRMARRWEVGGRLSKEAWRSDAKIYYEQHASFQAIGWVDSEFRVKWIEPLEGNKPAQGLDLSFEEERRKALIKAKNDREVKVTGTVDLVQGGKGFLVYVPIFHKNNFEGFILGVFRIEKLLGYIVKEHAELEGVVFELFDGEELLFTNTDSSLKGQEKWFHDAYINFYNSSWTLRVWPKKDVWGSGNPFKLYLELALGFLITGLLAFSVYTSQKAQLHAREIELVAWSLETEIQERKEIEKALDESEKSLRTVVENIVDGIITIDVEGHIQSFNKSAEKIFGYRASEIIGQSVNLLMPEPYKTEHDGYIDNYLRTNEAKIIGIGREVVGQHKDGSLFPMDLAVNEVKIDDKICFTGVIRNITERKKAKEALQKAHDELEIRVRERTAELEAKNKDLGEFAYIASHDLQEPLRKVSMFADRLKSAAADQFGERENDYIDRMQNAVFRMQKLIDDLLVYSRASQKMPVFKKIDLNKTLPAVVSDLETQIGRVKGKVEFSELPEIKADETQMRQLFQNLISNGLKYSKPSEPPVVRVSCKEDMERGLIQIMVEDNGIGMEGHHLERIFNPFERLHNDKKFKGSGIGLAICKKIVGRHNGTLEVKSQPGKGSVFTINLPANLQTQVV